MDMINIDACINKLMVDSALMKEAIVELTKRIEEIVELIK